MFVDHCIDNITFSAIEMPMAVAGLVCLHWSERQNIYVFSN